MLHLRRILSFSGLLALILLMTSGCALLVRGAAAGARGAAVGGAAGVGSAARLGVARSAVGSVPASNIVLGSGPLVAGIGALALGRALPRGVAKIYGSTGEYGGHVESRGSTASYYDRFGRLTARSEQVGPATHFYDSITGRYLGHSRSVGNNRINVYSHEGELLGYDVLDGGRIVWHFEANGRLAGYTVLGDLDVAGLGLRTDAIAFSLSAAGTALLAGKDDQKTRQEPLIQADRSVSPLSPRVVERLDQLFKFSDSCRTTDDVESCRSVSLAYVHLREAIREELVRLAKPPGDKKG